MKTDNTASSASTPPENKKLEALVHYVAHKCSDQSRLGAIKLNKILWFSDSISYLNTGKSISGARYMKQRLGPVPKDMLKVQEALKSKGAILISKEETRLGHQQTKFTSLKTPDLSEFTANDISLVDDVLEHICDHHTGTSISEATHDIVWQAAEIGEEIPLYAVFASRIGNIDGQDVAWAKNIAIQKSMVG